MTATSARIVDGRALARRVKEGVRARAEALRAAGRVPRLDALLVGGDASARLYAENQARTCEELGLAYRLHEIPPTADDAAVVARVQALNADPSVRALMIHMPLPAHVNTERVQSAIDVEKDVEGVNPANIGNVVYGRRSHVPCTALAVMHVIESQGVALRGTHCVCVGASNIVGKPVAILLMRAEATVVSTNKYTRNLAELTREGDVLVAAAGVPGLIRAEMVKPGALVVDVGVNRVVDAAGASRTVGDVDFDGVRAVAGAVTPVPGGVGPITVAMLLRNAVEAWEV